MSGTTPIPANTRPQYPTPIPVITKNRAAFDTANDDMIQQTGDIETRGTRHERKITEG
jgi:hypothetical protein